MTLLIELAALVFLGWVAYRQFVGMVQAWRKLMDAIGSGRKP